MTMDNLARCAMLAKQEGMSYGQWMALHGQTIVKEEKELPKGWKLCEECGKPFYSKCGKRFCEPYCRIKAYSRKDVERKKTYMRKYREQRKAEKTA
jgi:uncharacterized Zn finger protein (UPF0148 family)